MAFVYSPAQTQLKLNAIEGSAVQPMHTQYSDSNENCTVVYTHRAASGFSDSRRDETRHDSDKQHNAITGLLRAGHRLHLCHTTIEHRS